MLAYAHAGTPPHFCRASARSISASASVEQCKVRWACTLISCASFRDCTFHYKNTERTCAESLSLGQQLSCDHDCPINSTAPSVVFRGASLQLCESVQQPRLRSPALVYSDQFVEQCFMLGFVFDLRLSGGPAPSPRVRHSATALFTIKTERTCAESPQPWSITYLRSTTNSFHYSQTSNSLITSCHFFP
jgi:hypothetical protein